MDPSTNPETLPPAGEDVRPTPPGSAPDWRQSKWLALAEFAAVVLVFVAARWHLIPFSTTPFLLLVGWVALRVRKVGWSNTPRTRARKSGATSSIDRAGGATLVGSAGSAA